MLKNLIFICFATFTLCHIGIFAAPQTKSLNCDYSLQPLMKKILQIQDASELIDTIQQEGPIQITAKRHPLSDQFGAFWDLERRTICVNPKSSEGEKIGSILFELQNAAVNSKLEQLDQMASTGKIDRESYIRGVEYLEYLNSKRAAKIATEGINKGLFPANARLDTYANFEEHYRYQRIGGHSEMISKNFDLLAPKRTQRM